MDLAPGKTVGDFRLLSIIGQGGMGVVWEAEQLSLGNRRVAVKFVRPERVTGHLLELLAREARAGGRLSHPGIVAVHGYGRSASVAWIALELVQGGSTLRDLLDGITRAAEVPPGYDCQVARLVAEIAEAMQAAHDACVIHRDLKPQNVLLTPEGHPKVTDFGLARITDESSLSQAGEVAGTFLYMSPEQVLAGAIDQRTDVFSLGVILYELLALRRPFQGDTNHQIAAQILSRDPPDPRTMRSRVPRDLAVIAAKALEKDREKRFQSMRELAEDLRRFLASLPIRASPPTPVDRVLKWVRRNPAKASVTSVAGVAFGVISLLLIQNLRTNRALRLERTNLARLNTALELKMRESEQAAERERILAGMERQRADEVLRLSALQKLDDLVAEAGRLWPAHPGIVERYVEWLQNAETLLSELPDHERTLAELRSRSRSPIEGEDSVPEAEADDLRVRQWHFDDSQDKWWHNQLEKLVEGLKVLADPEAGLLSSGASLRHGWGMRKRLEFAMTVRERSLDRPDAAQRWFDAIASIADPVACPSYRGLRIDPQLGLVPIGRDPGSGLWEFAHLQTGEVPERSFEGGLLLGEETALVFVLLPGGTFSMGAQTLDPHGPNYDPEAREDEGPVHEVTLSPFFLSKYEMTQAQWLRFTGDNPSHYKPPHDLARSLTHPVDQVSWASCVTAMSRLGLSLPSEAQWEYAARGGTTTPWWTGNERESLRGAANLADQAAKRVGAPWADIGDWPELDDGYAAHAPADRFRPNPFGLHNAHGNVWEWCQDPFDEYAPGPSIDPVAARGVSPNRVYRGGSFNFSASLARAAFRRSFPPDNSNPNLGLRPAKNLASSR